MIELLKKFLAITGQKNNNHSAESIAFDIFNALDIDHNQSLSKEEFVNGCLKNESIRRLLSLFETDYPPKS
jgi:hypothetical protein